MRRVVSAPLEKGNERAGPVETGQATCGGLKPDWVRIVAVGAHLPGWAVTP